MIGMLTVPERTQVVEPDMNGEGPHPEGRSHWLPAGDYVVLHLTGAGVMLDDGEGVNWFMSWERHPASRL